MSFVARLRSLSADRQLALAAVTAVVIAVLFGSLYLLTRPRYEVLFRDLRPADAATIVEQLDKEQKPYKLEDGGATILAPAGSIDETRLAIMGADLPLNGTVGFELFSKSDMGLTEFAQRINYQRALQGELARTIMTIEAIETARVHLTLPEPSIFRGERKPAEASVTLTTRPGRLLSSDAVAGIQRLVAASAPDLEVGSVVVLDAHGTLVAGAAAPEGPEAPVPATVQQTRAIEQYYAASLRRALEPLYPGVRVQVTIPADQWAVGAVSEQVREAALESWARDERDFRLLVAVSTPAGLGDLQQDDVGRIVADVSGLSRERGDSLIFPAWNAVEAASAEPAPITPSLQGGAPSAAPSPGLAPTRRDLPPWIWGLAAIGLLAGVVLLLRQRRRRPATLTLQQRDAYVSRLKRLLAEEGGHVG